ncbi:MAG: tRNA epoxyqueuosine(34) reductase QueG [Polyangia bacterium]|nr:tRNA epoxyqueuosine(34) reductase QueG [Polyangia bacterium]
MSGQEYKVELERLARALGCVAFGVTEASPLTDHDRFRRWLARGWHGAMGYLARDEAVRADPRLYFPEARSVLCVALPYSIPIRASAEPETVGLEDSGTESSGRKAGLFAGRDYHEVMGGILGALGAQGARLARGATRWLPAVDTRPLLERSLAMRAGLGAIGRHTQLIVPGHGSLVCLGLLLTDAVLPPDAPCGDDLCAGCDLCIRACPARALHRDSGLEAPRCLSYLTTASREAIPQDLRTVLGVRLYGCDDCQEACPWNHPPRRPAGAGHPGLAGDPLVPREILESWLLAPGRRLRRELHGTALGHLPAAALRRTACVVLGNLGDPASRPALERAAQTASDQVIREHASWALGRLPPEET